jgi:hypothetical protein
MKSHRERKALSKEAIKAAGGHKAQYSRTRRLLCACVGNRPGGDPARA